jgi:hypothetical protein
MTLCHSIFECPGQRVATPRIIHAAGSGPLFTMPVARVGTSIARRSNVHRRETHHYDYCGDRHCQKDMARYW